MPVSITVTEIKNWWATWLALAARCFRPSGICRRLSRPISIKGTQAGFVLGKSNPYACKPTPCSQLTWLPVAKGQRLGTAVHAQPADLTQPSACTETDPASAFSSWSSLEAAAGISHRKLQPWRCSGLCFSCSIDSANNCKDVWNAPHRNDNPRVGNGFFFFFCHALHLHQWDVTILHLSLVKSGVSEVCKNEINFKGQRF